MILGGLQTETGPSPAFPQNASPLPDGLNMANADIIIQSCDSINFRVHKLVLSLSSPFFSDMFSLPQPSESDQEVVDGLPVVRLSEDAEVLKCLLTMLYPIPSMIPNSYDKTLTLLGVSQKYDMDGVQSRIRAETQSKKLPMPTGAAAFRAYAIASTGGLSPEKETLARLTLDSPMTFEYLCDELPSLKAGHYAILSDFANAAEIISSHASRLFSISAIPHSIFVTGRLVHLRIHIRVI